MSLYESISLTGAYGRLTRKAVHRQSTYPYRVLKQRTFGQLVRVSSSSDHLWLPAPESPQAARRLPANADRLL